MTNPVEPIDKKTYFYVRLFRYILLLITMVPIGYFFFTDEIWWGFGLTILGSIFWVVEIKRGNQTEDYLIDNYENPLK